MSIFSSGNIYWIFYGLGLACLAVPFLISDVICSYYIVPEIERKIKKKLDYSNSTWSSGTGRALEITGMIMDTYYPNRKKQYLRWFPRFIYSQHVLDESGYTRDMVSRRELLFCNVNRYCLYVGLFLVVVGFFLSAVQQ